MNAEKRTPPAPTQPVAKPPATLTAAADPKPDHLHRSREAAWERLLTRF